MADLLLGFLRSLYERPGDQATRMAFADWLEEEGQHAQAAALRGAVFMVEVFVFVSQDEDRQLKLSETFTDLEPACARAWALARDPIIVRSRTVDYAGDLVRLREVMPGGPAAAPPGWSGVLGELRIQGFGRDLVSRAGFFATHPRAQLE